MAGWLCSAIELSCVGVRICDECGAFCSGMRLPIPPAMLLKPDSVELVGLSKVD